VNRTSFVKESVGARKTQRVNIFRSSSSSCKFFIRIVEEHILLPTCICNVSILHVGSSEIFPEFM
jgi:hypothetical protein